MKLDTAIIAVKRIRSDVPRSNFPEKKLSKLAHCILELEGVINPPVVAETDSRSYEVVDGHFEYYAAVKAREIDPRKGEMTGVFLIEPENEASLQEQIKLLRKPRSVEKTDTPSDSGESGIRLTNIESRLTNIESRLESRFEPALNELKGENREMRMETNLLKDRKNEQIQNPLDIFNLMDKRNMIHLAHMREKVADAVIRERKKEKFESLDDVIKRFKGKRVLSVNGMLKIIDKWSQTMECSR